MTKIKLASAAAIFDRRFYRTFGGGVPDIKESRMLIAKRPENDDWSPGQWSPPVETYEPKEDENIHKHPLQEVMKNAFLRGFQEEFIPDKRLGLPSLQYIGNYSDEKTNFTVYSFMGYFWNNSAWSPRRDLKDMLHTTKEVPEYGWKTLQEVIEMKKKDEIAGEKFIDMVVQEVERRMTGDPQFEGRQDTLSRWYLKI